MKSPEERVKKVRGGEVGRSRVCFSSTSGIRNVRRARYLLAPFLDSATREFHDIVIRGYGFVYI